MPFADNVSTIHLTRPQRVRHDVIRMEAEQQIRENRVVINSVAFARGESGKILAPQLAILAHGLGSAPKLHGTADISAMGRTVVAREVIADGIERRMQ